MSAAVWNEPHDPELRCGPARRTTGASENGTVLTTRIIRAPRQPGDRDTRVAGTTVRR
ncbi:MAG TPA: hypothetical protein VL551_00785 [Actinospica sp.]|jgi:hypothetical protein|nr:hypothetical protein [Actinospica sp.]